jgi:hypothetical protein
VLCQKAQAVNFSVIFVLRCAPVRGVGSVGALPDAKLTPPPAGA